MVHTGILPHSSTVYHGTGVQDGMVGLASHMHGTCWDFTTQFHGVPWNIYTYYSSTWVPDGIGNGCVKIGII